VPYILHNFLPMYIPVHFFRFHMVTYLIYIVIISIEETFTYSGYSILPISMLQGAASRVNGHLSSDGRKYFGRIGLADLVMGTGEFLGGLVGGRGVEDDRRRRRR
jgi:hypothetical protein